MPRASRARSTSRRSRSRRARCWASEAVEPRPPRPARRPAATRFFFLGLGLLWASVFQILRKQPPGTILTTCLWLSLPFTVFLAFPVGLLGERPEVRRYCMARGFKIHKFKWRGLIYMDGDVTRYSRWPEDFKLRPEAKPEEW